MVAAGLKKTAVLCVLKNKQQFLLLKRLKEPNKNRYTPVGGKLDPYETPLQAALRETMEETGIVLSNMKYCGTLVETSPADYNWISFVYMAEVEQIFPPNCNEGALEWIAFADVLNVPTPASDWFIYKYLLQEKIFAFNAVYDAQLQMIYMQNDLTGEMVIGDLPQ